VGSDKVAKDLFRSFSMGESSGLGKIEMNEGEKSGETVAGRVLFCVLLVIFNTDATLFFSLFSVFFLSFNNFRPSFL